MVKAIWAVACFVLAVSLILFQPTAFVLAGQAPGIPAAPSTSSPPSPGGPTDDTAYRLGPEDQLRISVWDNKDLTLDLVVRPDGKISMPLIQDVVAEGLTAPDLAKEIEKRLSAYIVNPEVSVIVLQVNSPKYYIIGSIARPGTYPLRGEVSVLQALALAGGFTQFASPRKIKLIRNTGGKQEIRKINYYDMIDDGGTGNYFLRPDDTIVVP
jgi:polysaccharide export outer membrane protein